MEIPKSNFIPRPILITKPTPILEPNPDSILEPISY